MKIKQFYSKEVYQRYWFINCMWSKMRMKIYKCFILLGVVLLLLLLWKLVLQRTLFMLDIHFDRLKFARNSTGRCVNDPSSTGANEIRNEVTYYNLSRDRFSHYEYRYELNRSSPRLILLLGGISRSCVDWWSFSVGQRILLKMRSEGFSVLAICSMRKNYLIQMPIQTNSDVKSIYLSLQIWMNDIYFRRFQRYPLLYLFGISQGSRMGSLLCRVLPVQAQIFYIFPGYRPSLLIRSDYDRAMQNRLIADPTFANWFYFDFCSKTNAHTNDLCPFRRSNKNHFNAIPPTYFVHAHNDQLLKLSNYTDIISDIQKDSLYLGGELLSHKNSLKLDTIHPLKITPHYMRDNFDKWFCKSSSSNFFYEHLMNSTIETKNKQSGTCWCSQIDFIYFARYSNLTKSWSTMKQETYRDYVKDFQTYRELLCEELCGDIMATHAMLSRNIGKTLRWLKAMDHQRSLYKIKEFLRRPFCLWMYNKAELVQNIQYLAYQTPMRSSCGRRYDPYQMYSPEYFLQDYFQRLKQSHPLSRHNFTWCHNPVLADYYIIPHDYSCISLDSYRPTLNHFEYQSFYNRLNQDYFIPLLANVRTRFPYWNRTSGSNHLIAFTLGKNMGVVQNSFILDSLKNVIQLGLTGFRQDLLPLNSSRQYVHRNVTPVYRHNYDIVIPPFNRLQLIHNNTLNNLITLYDMKKSLMLFAGTFNNSISFESARQRLSSFATDQIGNGKRFNQITTIEGKQLHTVTLIDGLMSPIAYGQLIRSTIFHLCPEGFSPWSPRLYESICLGAIPLILADSIVLPFERFIDWRSFSAKINVTNVEKILDFITDIDHFKEYVEQKLNNAALYVHAFRWPYSPIDSTADRHRFLPEEDLDGTANNVFHYLFLELRCRRLEQFYGLTSNTFSIESIAARRQACTNHASICPCDEEQQSLAYQQYL